MNRKIMGGALYSADEKTKYAMIRNDLFSQARKILAEEDSVGKKMDFLVQEINREVNTTGSKANDIEITSRVLSMKNLVEEIREQIQNLV